MNNFIHPTAIIEPGVLIGSNNYIGPFCYIGKRVRLGDNNRLVGHVSIGTPAESRGHPWAFPGTVHIGNNNVLREFVTVNASTDVLTPTTIESNCYLMTKAHVGHDACLNDWVTLACGAIIGGHSVLHDRCNIGINAAVHQKIIVGACTMLGMGAMLTKHAHPFQTWVGVPARAIKENLEGLKRADWLEPDLERHRKTFLYHCELFLDKFGK